MKFMKLGSKPDLFKSVGNSTRYVECELLPDVVINVGEARFHLHKFPLISKSQRLRESLRREGDEEENPDELRLDDFPGGPRAFEICAKFCYGMVVTLNAHNVVAARCAAEYLEMREDVDRGNFIYKIEVFLTSSIFHSWKDSIICLQTSKTFLPWSKDLRILQRSVDSIASMISLEPRAVHWSYTYHRRISAPGELVDQRVPVDWWVEDLSELDVDRYEMVMLVVKDKGKASAEVVIESLKAYSERWLPRSTDDLAPEGLVRALIRLTPPGFASRSSCSFLLKLLKVVVLTGEDQTKEDLLTMISMQLEKASVKDLLIPLDKVNSTVYDIDIVLELLHRYEARKLESNDSDSGPSDQIWKLVDSYLAERASDPNLPLSTFVDFVKAIPEAARPVHDGLYAAVDVYLKEHPAMSKVEKKILCGVIDVKKLSKDACAHAVQNERLPLRMVVQVLFYEQVRSAPPLYLQGRCLSAKHEGAELQLKGLLHTSSGSEKSGDSLAAALPSRSRRMLDKFWASKTEKRKSSEKSCSSPMSSSASVFPTRSGTSEPPSRLGRHSIS